MLIISVVLTATQLCICIDFLVTINQRLILLLIGYSVYIMFIMFRSVVLDHF